MGKTIIKFDDIKIKKQKFHQKRPISIDNKDVNKIVVSNTTILKKLDLSSYFFQKWLRIEEILIKLKTECMTFLIKDDKLLEKYNEIWEKVSKIIYKIW